MIERPVIIPDYRYSSGIGGGQVGYASTPGTLALDGAEGSPLEHRAPVLEREVVATATGKRARGQGGSFRPRPGWPPADGLDYVNKLATAVLLLIAVALITYHGIRRPERALSMLATGAKRRAGVA